MLCVFVFADSQIHNPHTKAVEELQVEQLFQHKTTFSQISGQKKKKKKNFFWPVIKLH